jgi:hypothetical protein
LILKKGEKTPPVVFAKLIRSSPSLFMRFLVVIALVLTVVSRLVVAATAAIVTGVGPGIVAVSSRAVVAVTVVRGSRLAEGRSSPSGTSCATRARF